MEKTFKSALGAATVVAIFFLLNFHISSCTGGGGSIDTSGNNGSNPKLLGPDPINLITSYPIKAGTQLVLKCTTPGCVSSGDTSGTISGPKYIGICTIPYNI